MLNTRELMDIAAVLRTARTVRAYNDGTGSDRTDIDFLFNALQANKFLEEKITGSILGRMRSPMQPAASWPQSAARCVPPPPGAGHAAEDHSLAGYSKPCRSIITQRSERYVLPVKAEYRSAIPGLVHDVSSSGATLFVEPMGVVKANNELRELRAKEKAEIERILMELSADCAEHREDITLDFTMLVELDAIFARAKLSYKLNCGEAVLSEGALRLRRARHPLLDQSAAVPIDAELGRDFDISSFTGPNTGGKTVSLKTLGLLSLMNQCGLHIPAGDGSELPVFTKVLADIGTSRASSSP
jgi:DNA mismatch repair protein MutS2